ncbi:MAG: hypothetical protein ACOXZ0_05220 [Eubacteriales bacterium]|jgi:hypothetical protein
MKQVMKNQRSGGEDERKQDKDRGNYGITGMTFGLAIGAGLGAAFDSLALGVSLGMCGGMLLGLAIEKMQK